MAKVVSILSPLPGVDFQVGSISLRSTKLESGERRAWDVEVSVNRGKSSDDPGQVFHLGEYRTGLSAALAFEAGNRKHLVWDCLTIALASEEQADLINALNEKLPGCVETILNACAIAEEELYGQEDS